MVVFSRAGEEMPDNCKQVTELRKTPQMPHAKQVGNAARREPFGMLSAINHPV
jgi:hypothetical protein